MTCVFFKWLCLMFLIICPILCFLLYYQHQQHIQSIEEFSDEFIVGLGNQHENIDEFTALLDDNPIQVASEVYTNFNMFNHYIYLQNVNAIFNKNYALNVLYLLKNKILLIIVFEPEELIFDKINDLTKSFGNLYESNVYMFVDQHFNIENGKRLNKNVTIFGDVMYKENSIILTNTGKKLDLPYSQIEPNFIELPTAPLAESSNEETQNIINKEDRFEIFNKNLGLLVVKRKNKESLLNTVRNIFR